MRRHIPLWAIVSVSAQSHRGLGAHPACEPTSFEPKAGSSTGPFAAPTASFNRVIYANSDVITFHDYGPAEDLAQHIEMLQEHGRPLINTEWLNRGRGSLVETCLPVFARENVGCMHWGLINGKTQTHLHWGWRPGKGEPEVWQHDLFHNDGKPYRPDELDRFRQYLQAGRPGGK